MLEVPATLGTKSGVRVLDCVVEELGKQSLTTWEGARSLFVILRLALYIAFLLLWIDKKIRSPFDWLYAQLNSASRLIKGKIFTVWVFLQANKCLEIFVRLCNSTFLSDMNISIQVALHTFQSLCEKVTQSAFLLVVDEAQILLYTPTSLPIEVSWKESETNWEHHFHHSNYFTFFCKDESSHGLRVSPGTRQMTGEEEKPKSKQNDFS